MLEILEQEGRANNMSKAVTRYPTGHDTAPAASAGGEVSGDVTTEGTEEIYLDANLFDQHVRELVTQAGGTYSFKGAVGSGLMKRVDPELLAAIGRLEKAAPLLNKAVQLARQRAKDSASGSSSGSASGSASGSGSETGSESGSASGSMSGDLSKFIAGDQDAGLRFMGHR